MIGLRQNHRPRCTHMTCRGASAGAGAGSGGGWRCHEVKCGKLRAGPGPGNRPQQEGRNPSPTPAKPPGLPPAPHLPDQWLPLGGVQEQSTSQAFIERPVGAVGAGAADAGVLGMEQRVSISRPLPPATPV